MKMSRSASMSKEINRKREIVEICYTKISIPQHKTPMMFCLEKSTNLLASPVTPNMQMLPMINSLLGNEKCKYKSTQAAGVPSATVVPFSVTTATSTGTSAAAGISFDVPFKGFLGDAT